MAAIETIARLDPAGRIVIPAQHRRALGVGPGDEVVLVLEDDELRIMTARTAIARAQALVRPYLRPRESLAGSLIADRRREGSE